MNQGASVAPSLAMKEYIIVVPSAREILFGFNFGHEIESILKAADKFWVVNR